MLGDSTLIQNKKRKKINELDAVGTRTSDRTIRAGLRREDLTPGFNHSATMTYI